MLDLLRLFATLLAKATHIVGSAAKMAMHPNKRGRRQAILQCSDQYCAVLEWREGEGMLMRQDRVDTQGHTCLVPLGGTGTGVQNNGKRSRRLRSPRLCQAGQNDSSLFAQKLNTVDKKSEFLLEYPTLLAPASLWELHNCSINLTSSSGAMRLVKSMTRSQERTESSGKVPR